MANFSKPTVIPRWADTGVRVEPSEAKKDAGWVSPEKPPDSFFNWIDGITGDWIKWFDERFSDGATDDDLTLAAPTDGSGDLLLQAGTALGVDLDGGDLLLEAGDSTGTGTSSMFLRVAEAGTTGSTPNAVTPYLILDGVDQRLEVQREMAFTNSVTYASPVPPGSTTGGLISGPPSFHLGLDINGNDASDSFFIRRDASNGGGPVDTIGWTFRNDGRLGINQDSPLFRIHQTGGSHSDVLSLGGSDFTVNYLNETVSGRTGFLTRVTNDFLDLSPGGADAGFGFLFPFNDSVTSDDGEYKPFRLMVGVTLADRFWVDKFGSGFFGGPEGVAGRFKLHVRADGAFTAARFERSDVPAFVDINFTGGNSEMRFDVNTGAQTFTVGVDDASSGDMFKIADSVGFGTPRYVIDASGRHGFNDEPDVLGNLGFTLEPSGPITILTASTFGTRLIGRLGGHIVAEIRGNEGGDSFAVLGDADFDGVSDTVVLRCLGSGNTMLGHNTAVTRLDVNGGGVFRLDRQTVTSQALLVERNAQNAVMARGRFTGVDTCALLGDHWNIATCSRDNEGTYTITLDEAVDVNCTILVTVRDDSTSSNALVAHAEFLGSGSSRTQLRVETRVIALASAVSDLNFNLLVLGRPATLP